MSDFIFPSLSLRFRIIVSKVRSFKHGFAIEETILEHTVIIGSSDELDFAKEESSVPRRKTCMFVLPEQGKRKELEEASLKV